MTPAALVMLVLLAFVALVLGAVGGALSDVEAHSWPWRAPSRRPAALLRAARRALPSLIALAIVGVGLAPGVATAGLPLGTGVMGRGIGAPQACQYLGHMDGANGGTTFADASPAGRAITRLTNGGALPTTSTTQAKFGATSASIDTRSALQVGGALALGAKDFTLDAWIWPTQNNNETLTQWDLAAGADRKSFAAYHFAGGAPQITYFYWTTDGSTSTSVNANSSAGLNAWHHIVWQRSGGLLRIYVDGVRVYQAANAVNIWTTAKELLVGNAYDTYPAVSATLGINGYLDEARVVVGRAMYPTNARWTVPNRAH